MGQVGGLIDGLEGLTGGWASTAWPCAWPVRTGNRGKEDGFVN